MGLISHALLSTPSTGQNSDTLVSNPSTVGGGFCVPVPPVFWWDIGMRSILYNLKYSSLLIDVSFCGFLIMLFPQQDLTLNNDYIWIHLMIRGSVSFRPWPGILLIASTVVRLVSPVPIWKFLFWKSQPGPWGLWWKWCLYEKPIASPVSIRCSVGKGHHMYLRKSSRLWSVRPALATSLFKIGNFNIHQSSPPSFLSLSKKYILFSKISFSLLLLRSPASLAAFLWPRWLGTSLSASLCLPIPVWLTASKRWLPLGTSEGISQE